MRSICLVTITPLVAVTLLAACDPEPEPDPGVDVGVDVDDTGEPRIELAASSPDGLVDMTDGSTVPLIMGPQGGYHLDVGVRFYGFDPEGARLRYEVWSTDGERAFHPDANYAIRRDRLDTVGDHYERTGDRAFLDITAPSEIAGHTVDIIALLETPDATRHDDIRTVTVR